MDFNHLYFFNQIVEHKNISQAAIALNMQKSKLSRVLKSLETELKCNLVYRNTRKISLTEAGKRLYERSKIPLLELKKLERDIQRNADQSKTLLKITTTEDIGTLLLSPILNEITKVYNELQIELILSDQEFDIIKEGIDLAIRIGDLADSDLKSHFIGHLRFILVASPQYLEKNPNLTHIEKISSHPVLWFSAGDDEERWKLFKTRSKQEFSIDVKIKHRSNNPRIILDFVKNDQGIALLPEFLCHNLIKNGDLLQVFKSYEAKPIPVHFVWPPQTQAPKVLKDFIKLAKQKLQNYFH